MIAVHECVRMMLQCSRAPLTRLSPPELLQLIDQHLDVLVPSSQLRPEALDVPGM